jgi:hypothetical protein
VEAISVSQVCRFLQQAAVQPHRGNRRVKGTHIGA